MYPVCVDEHVLLELFYYGIHIVHVTVLKKYISIRLSTCITVSNMWVQYLGNVL